MKREIPEGVHITYQKQYRKCGKATCKPCREGKGHGPYWYFYYREGKKLKSGYIGKERTGEHRRAVASKTSAV